METRPTRTRRPEDPATPPPAQADAGGACRRIGIHQSDLSRMEQGEYKVGLDTLLKILGTFDLSIGDFFEEGANRTKSVIQKYSTLSPTAQREVDSFIEFKRLQEGELDEEGGSEGEDES